jgi:hypothetical protein
MSYYEEHLIVSIQVAVCLSVITGQRIPLNIGMQPCPPPRTAYLLKEGIGRLSEATFLASCTVTFRAYNESVISG